MFKIFLAFEEAKASAKNCYALHIKLKVSNVTFSPLISNPLLLLFSSPLPYPILFLPIYLCYLSVFSLSRPPLSLSRLLPHSVSVNIHVYTYECGCTYVIVPLWESKEFWVSFTIFPPCF